MNLKKVYKKIARTHGVSVTEIAQEIQTAIDAAYTNPAFHAKCVYRKGDKPTPEEFLAHITRRALAGTNGLLTHHKTC